MTTTVQTSTTSTTMPECPGWCRGAHDLDRMTEQGIAHWRGSDGGRLPGGNSEVLLREHVGEEQTIAWLSRYDVMTEDGAWWQGATRIGVGDPGDLSAAQARELAAMLLALADLAGDSL